MVGNIVDRWRPGMRCILLLLAMAFGLNTPLHGQRLLSLAPSLTETVCDLGLCDHLVGVTDHCLYPPKVRSVEKIGGYLEPNFERITVLKPDLIFALPEHRDASSRLKQLGFQVETLQNYTLGDIHETIRQIGRLTGRSDRAEQRIEELLEIQTSLERKSERTWRCIMVLGHSQDSQPIKDVYAVGQKGFLNELLALAGGENAIAQDQPFFPKLGQEGLLALDPDVIIELIPDSVPTAEMLSGRKRQWARMEHLKAVKNKRVFIFSADHVLQAGPRYLETLRFLSNTLEKL